jgi:hypothetical protein
MDGHLTQDLRIGAGKVVSREKPPWKKAARTAAVVSSWLALLVLLHDLVGAVPSLTAFVAAVGTLGYASLSTDAVVPAIALSVGLAALALLWSERSRAERQAVGFDQINRLIQSRLRLEALALDEQTANWLEVDLQPAIGEFASNVGLAVIRRKDGVDELPCAVGVPEFVREAFPKQTNRPPSEYLAALRLDHWIQVPLSPTSGTEWLLIITSSALDEPAKTVFRVGARLISDARASAS